MLYRTLLPFLVVILLFPACSEEKPGPSPTGPEKAGTRESSPPPRPAPPRAHQPRKKAVLDLAEYGPTPVVELHTSQGVIELALDAGKAPKTVQTFLSYCLDRFYVGTLFHRVVKGFCIQGGGKIKGSGEDLVTKPPTYENIPSEADNGLPQKRGAVLMSRRRSDPDSATCQFFILLKDQVSKQPRPGQRKRKSPRYTIFGRVARGMEVVDRIAALPLEPYKKSQLKEPPLIQEVVVRRSAVGPEKVK